MTPYCKSKLLEEGGSMGTVKELCELMYIAFNTAKILAVLQMNQLGHPECEVRG